MRLVWCIYMYGYLLWFYAGQTQVFSRAYPQESVFQLQHMHFWHREGLPDASQWGCPSSHVCPWARASWLPNYSYPKEWKWCLVLLCLSLITLNISYTVRQQKWNLIACEEKIQYSGQCICFLLYVKEMQLPGTCLNTLWLMWVYPQSDNPGPCPFCLTLLRFRASFFLSQIIP